jgi:hypothetical protein
MGNPREVHPDASRLIKKGNNIFPFFVNKYEYLYILISDHNHLTITLKENTMNKIEILTERATGKLVAFDQEGKEYSPQEILEVLRKAALSGHYSISVPHVE